MARALKIYVAGPYTAPDDDGHEANTQHAIDAGIRVFEKGHYPYIPHLTHYVDLRARRIGAKLSWEDYIKWDTPWLKTCDALLYLGKSKGADLELELARKLKKQIFFSLSEIPVVTHRVSSEIKPSSKRK
jgi:hypothetical protein